MEEQFGPGHYIVVFIKDMVLRINKSLLDVSEPPTHT
jgi:hypothetical protein